MAKIVGDDTLQKMLLVISSAEDGIKKLEKVYSVGLYRNRLNQFKSNQERIDKVSCRENISSL